MTVTALRPIAPPSSADAVRRSEAKKRDRGLKEIRVWIPDTEISDRSIRMYAQGLCEGATTMEPTIDDVRRLTLASDVHRAAAALARTYINDRDCLSSWDRVIDYLRVQQAHSNVETFRVMFLDKRNALIADEVQGVGTVDHCPVYPREVVKRALDLDAIAIIIVHNHPSGDPSPSRADIEMTRQVNTACATVGVTLHDHIIVASTGTTSFRSQGLL